MVAITHPTARTSPLESPRRPIFASRRAKIDSVANTLVGDQLGQAMVEMAVVLPGFFLMVFGIFTYSLILFGRGNAIYAANAAARYAAIHSSTALVPSTVASVKSVATPYLYGATVPANAVTVTYSPSNTIGSTVTVKIAITYSTGLPFYQGSNVTVAANAVRTISR